MDFSDLQTFRTVVEDGGVTAAARKLNRVQSSVSARLAALERDLGCQLFERSGRRMALTPEGRHLYERSAALVRDWVYLRQELRGPSQGAVLRLGSMESTAAVRLVPVLAQLRHSQPALRLSLRTGTTQALLEALERHEIDAALVAGPAGRSGLHWEAAFEEQLVLIGPPESGAGGEPSLVSFSTGCAYREVAVAWAKSRGVNWAGCTEIGSYHALVAAVAAGMGVGLVPASVLRHLDQRGIVVRPLEASWANQTTWFVTREGSLSAALQAMRQALPAGAGALT